MDFAEGVIGFGVVGIDLDGAIGVGEGDVATAGRKGEEGEVVEGHGVGGVEPEHFEVALFGFGEVAGVLQVDSAEERVVAIDDVEGHRVS